MDVSVNYLAVVLAALAAMVIGSIWYSRAAFYKPWARLAKVKENPDFTTGQMVTVYVGAAIASLVTAFVLAHVSFLSNHFFHNSFLQDSLTTAFWLWLGFVATRFYLHDSFEGRRKKLTILNASHELVTLLVMGLIIGVMGV
jgi:hypothetical protein